MADSRKRIAGAFLIGGALIVGSFVLSKNAADGSQEGSVVVATIERSHMNVDDTNNDGVPDWQESLLRAEPIIIQSTSTSETEVYERPKTVTGKFALTFFESLLRSKIYGAFGDTPEEVIDESTEALAKEAQDVLFIEDDLSIIESTDANILRAYGNHIAQIALSQKSDTQNEAIILQDALRYNEPERLAELEPIATSYVSIVKQMLEAPVPKKYVRHHLNLLNAYNAIREDVRGMQKIYDDPLYTFIRVKRYPDDVLGMYNALSELFDALYLVDGIEFTNGEQGKALTTMLQAI